jgi:threonine/homoserine/homoserine lactone efflux protein
MPLLIEPHLLIAFTAASLVLLAVPGPTIVMVVSQALAHGHRVAFASVIGVGLGDLAAASLSLLGVGTLLAASATAFTVIKLLGAAYLIWIGISMWRSPATPLKLNKVSIGGTDQSMTVFRDAFLVTLFNPKGIVFFVAFVPQFITHDHAFAPQAAVFVVIFVTLGMMNAAVYAMLASSARDWIKRPSVLRIATRIGAAFLISAGVASLFVRRAT